VGRPGNERAEPRLDRQTRILMQRATKLTTTTIAALALVLGLAACGSSDSDADRDTTTTEATSGSDETATTAADDETETDTTEDEGDDTPTTVVATGGGEFCEDLASYINEADMGDIDPTDPAAYEKAIKESAEESKDLLSKAPDELDDSVEVLVQLQEDLIEELEKVDYDFLKLSPDALGAMDDPKLEEANAELTAYVEDTCGIELPDAPEVEAPELSTEPVAPSGN
jgi:ABC-type Fe3+-hydroxamate transport system substrate-binding protein